MAVLDAYEVVISTFLVKSASKIVSVHLPAVSKIVSVHLPAVSKIVSAHSPGRTPYHYPSVSLTARNPSATTTSTMPAMPRSDGISPYSRKPMISAPAGSEPPSRMAVLPASR